VYRVEKDGGADNDERENENDDGMEFAEGENLNSWETMEE